MKTPLLRKWVLFIARHSRSRAMPYLPLFLTIIFGVMAYLQPANVHTHYFIFMSVLWASVTISSFERLGFVELVAEKDQEIRKLRNENADAA